MKLWLSDPIGLNLLTYKGGEGFKIEPCGDFTVSSKSQISSYSNDRQREKTEENEGTHDDTKNTD